MRPIAGQEVVRGGEFLANDQHVARLQYLINWSRIAGGRLGMWPGRTYTSAMPRPRASCTAYTPRPITSRPMWRSVRRPRTRIRVRTYVHSEGRSRSRSRSMIATSGARRRIVDRRLLEIGVMLVEISRRVPQVPGMIGIGERLLHVVVHPRRDAVDRVGLVQLAADDVVAVKRFAEEAGRVDQHGGRGERDEKLLRRRAVDPLDVPPDVEHQLEQRVAGFPIRKLQLADAELLGGRDVTPLGDDGGLIDRQGLGFELRKIVGQLDDGLGGGGELFAVHAIRAAWGVPAVGLRGGTAAESTAGRMPHDHTLNKRRRTRNESRNLLQKRLPRAVRQVL